MLSDARNVGDELATKLEQVMDKPIGWMDAPLDRYSPSSPDGLAVSEAHSAYQAQAVTRSCGLAKQIKDYIDWLDPSQVPSARTAIIKLLAGELDEASVESVLVKLDRATALFRSEEGNSL